MFRGCKQEDMPPHIYASAQTTYRNMLATNADQSLVLMGPSGSGKSVNCAHLLHYFCSTSVSPQSSLTGKILEIIAVLLALRSDKCKTTYYERRMIEYLIYWSALVYSFPLYLFLSSFLNPGTSCSKGGSLKTYSKRSFCAFYSALSTLAMLDIYSYSQALDKNEEKENDYWRS